MSERIKRGPFAGLRKNKYNVILADPAWAFSTFSNKRGQVPQRAEKQHYDVMTLEEMMDLPVEDVAAKDCALFMWVIDSHYDQAMALAAKWGFTYKTIAFAWKKKTKHGKDHIGLGHWTRKQIELCLLFTKGKPSRDGKGVRQLIEAPEFEAWIEAARREHSRKPDETRERIEALLAGPYLEMFARASAPGWDVWGNETEKFDDPIRSTRRDRSIEDILGSLA